MTFINGLMCVFCHDHTYRYMSLSFIFQFGSYQIDFETFNQCTLSLESWYNRHIRIFYINCCPTSIIKKKIDHEDCALGMDYENKQYTGGQ